MSAPQKPRSSSATANRRGMLAMLAAMAMFVVNDTLMKLAAATYPPGQIMAIRGLFASVMALGLVFAMREASRLRGLGSRAVLLRSGSEAASSFLFITALAALPLANITAIIQTSPMMITLASVALGIEQVGWRRWSAIVVGFAGVLLIVRPSLSGFDVFALIALAAAVTVAARDLLTRSIRDDVSTIIVTFATTAAVGLAGLLLALGEEWRPLAWRETLLLFGSGIAITLGNVAIIAAFRGADVSVVAPVRYTNVVFAILIGFVVFGELPDWISCAGIALIVASGAYAMHREQVRRRQGARALAATGASRPA